MANYKNFIKDFPIRCGKILQEYRDQGRKNGREVTHMFAIAAAAITIPFERLRKPPNGIQHPARDRERYEKANGKFHCLCDKSFLISCLWNDTERSWKSGIVKKEDVTQEPTSWIIASKSLPIDAKVKEVLEHIRNALAHGSIFTIPNPNDEIEHIIFLSKEKIDGKFFGDFRLIAVLAEDFYVFLVKWVSFLGELKIPLEPD